jgi:hypothetical protein
VWSQPGTCCMPAGTASAAGMSPTGGSAQALAFQQLAQLQVRP